MLHIIIISLIATVFFLILVGVFSLITVSLASSGNGVASVITAFLGFICGVGARIGGIVFSIFLFVDVIIWALKVAGVVIPGVNL